MECYTQLGNIKNQLSEACQYFYHLYLQRSPQIFFFSSSIILVYQFFNIQNQTNQLINYKKIKIIIIMRSLLSKKSISFFSNATMPVSLTFKQEHKSAHLLLSNTKKRNTLSTQTIKLLKKSLSDVQKKVRQKDVKILILQGQGTVFCSGHDLKQLNSSPNPRQIFDQCSQLMLKLRHFPVPTLCVINGIAAAAGFQMALACDLLVATQKSTFSTPGVKWGLFCSTPGVQLIRSINSQKKAMQMLLFGQSITAAEAYQYGLLNKVISQDKIQQTIDDYIKKANHLSGEVIKHGKMVLRSQRKQGIQKAYQIAGEAMHNNITQKQDCQQGLKAFAQKRHPKFKN